MQTLNHIGIIALNTFRESIRDKILYNIGFLAIALTLFSIVLGEWSVFDRAYVIKSTTLSVMDLSGLLISIFVGISLVQKEIQRRTVLTLLSKPISRAAFIVGKYFGLLAVVAVHLCLLTGIYYCILWVTNSSPTVSLLSAIYLIFCEMAIVIAVALLFSSFSSTVLSALFTLGVYFAGHLSDQLLEHVVCDSRKGGGRDSRRVPGTLPVQRDELRCSWRGTPGYVLVLEFRLCAWLHWSVPGGCELVV